MKRKNGLSLSWNNWTALKAISWTFGRSDRQTQSGGRSGVWTRTQTLGTVPGRQLLDFKRSPVDDRHTGGCWKGENRDTARPSPLISSWPPLLNTSLVRSMLGRKRVHQTRNVNIAQRKSQKHNETSVGTRTNTGKQNTVENKEICLDWLRTEAENPRSRLGSEANPFYLDA